MQRLAVGWKLAALRQPEDGQSMVEYGLLIVLIALVAAASIGAFGTFLDNKLYNDLIAGLTAATT